MSTYIVAITGASGALYARAMLLALKDLGHSTCLTITGPGQTLLQRELDWHLPAKTKLAEQELKRLLGYAAEDSRLQYFNWQDVGASIASGSFKTEGMIVIPCTMSTLAGISSGNSGNLVERAADVMLKERRPLVLVPRETPLNQIHLRNMLNLAELGVHIVPAMPAFYNRPESFAELANFVVGRVLDLLGVEHSLYQRWEG
ncbi:MAG: flavin prenyltransferase UbiX [Carboxydocellales bacterium]